LLLGPVPSQQPPGVEGGAPGHAVQPGAQIDPPGVPWGFADQDQERGLESILSVGGVAQQAPADAEHHRSMPAHQGRKRLLVLLVEESLQQLPVALVLGGVGVRQPEQLAQAYARLAAQHPTLRGGLDSNATLLLWREQAGFDTPL
jgi:hypothetical protein